MEPPAPLLHPVLAACRGAAEDPTRSFAESGGNRATSRKRSQIAAAFEQRNVMAHIVAEIDSLSLPMNCVYDGIGTAIKPMAAIVLGTQRGRRWRALPISDAGPIRRTDLRALAPECLSTAAAAVRAYA